MENENKSCMKAIDRTLKMLDLCQSVRVKVSADEKENWMHSPIKLSYCCDIQEGKNKSCVNRRLTVATPCVTGMGTASSLWNL